LQLLSCWVAATHGGVSAGVWSSFDPPDFTGRFLHGFDELVVSGTAAQNPADRFFDLLSRRSWVAVEQVLSSQDDGGNAEAALSRVVLHQSFLDRMQVLATANAFNGDDSFVSCLDRRYQTRVDEVVVHDDCAYAAVSGSAALFHSLQVQTVPKDIEESFCGLNGQCVVFAIHVEFYEMLCQLLSLPDDSVMAPDERAAEQYLRCLAPIVG